MKKFLIGVLCGVVISSATAVLAADSVQGIVASAVKFDINGKTSKVGDEYLTLNYNGHVYAPIRFIAESLGAVVEFENDEEMVIIRSGGLVISDPRFQGWTVGNLAVTSSGKGDKTRTKVTGQLKLSDTGLEHNGVKAGLTFYDSQQMQIGEVRLDGEYDTGKLLSFTVYGDGDFRNYSEVRLHIDSINGRSVDKEPPVLLTDILQNDFNHVTKITINFGPGTEIQTITDADAIGRITDQLKEIKLSKTFNQELMSGGWTYFMNIYSGDKWVQYGSHLQLQRKRYEHNATTNKLDEYIMRMNPNPT